MKLRTKPHSRKKTFFFTAMFVLFTFILTSSAASVCSASGKLSPALNIISENYSTAKSGLAGTDIYFELEDFQAALGIEKVGKITITALPDSTLGRLKLGAKSVEVGQTIADYNLDALKFEPYSNEKLVTTFSFCRGTTASGASYKCTIYALDSINTAPQIVLSESSQASSFAEAYSGITYLGTICAYDAENDEVSFEIIDTAKKGTLLLTDKNKGYFEYTANKNYEGRDTFSVRVSDKYGNRSAVREINITVSAPENEEVFEDMTGHWANSAVITCVRKGIIDNASDNDYFYPNEYMSRAEFLHFAMNAAGYKGFSILNTGYVDNEDIPKEYRGSVAAATAFGIVNGVETEKGMKFYPNSQITRSEAAVILYRLTGNHAEEYVSTFADDSSVPVWAVSAVNYLYNNGILRGNGNGIEPYAPITRGAAAQLIASIGK